MKSNQDRSKEIAQLVRAWISDRDALGDYGEWIQTSGPTAYKGVKRQELATALGVSKTTLNDNESSVELRNAEFRWCHDHLAKLESSKAGNAELRRSREGERRAKKRASSLEVNNSELIVENRILRSRLAKWEAIDKVLLETGRSPRSSFSDD